MIEVTDPAIFSLTAKQLVTHAAQVQQFKGRFVQIFLALKCFQNEIPSMWSGRSIGTDVLQTLLDDLYSKASRPANAGVWSLSTGEFLARTGLIGLGNDTAQNTWRNHFNLQKGIGCYATPQDLGSQTFLDEPRIDCQYLQPAIPNTLARATCSFCIGPNPPRYRRENHRKWLRISPDGGGYSTVDLRNVSNFAPYLAPGGHRIPLAPLLVCLYHDTFEGLPVSGRDRVGMLDFTTDFSFTQAEIEAYFDTSPFHPQNEVILNALPGSSLDSAGPIVQPAVAGAVQHPPSPEPLVPPTEIAPPMGNTGWDAERFVQQALEEAGWRVTDVSRQRLGYDLFAERGRLRRYVEVKSSINVCRPVLTSREWQQAQVQRRAYILAIVENFNPEQTNIIYWVPDPTSCSAREALTREYAIGRAAWASAAITLNDI